MELFRKISILAGILILLFFSGCSDLFLDSQVNQIDDLENLSSARSTSGFDGWVIVYENSDYRGQARSFRVTNSIINLENYGFDNKVSSFRCYPPGNSDEIILFNGKNGTGISVASGACKNLTDLGFNDIASSLAFTERHDSGKYVEFYTGKNFTGQYYRYSINRNDNLEQVYLPFQSMKYNGYLPLHLFGKNRLGKDIWATLSKGEYADLERYGLDSGFNGYGPATSTEPLLIVYDNSNYSGVSRTLPINNLTNIEMSHYGFNDDAASVRVINGRVNMYADSFNSGYMRGISGNVNFSYYGLYEKLSSVKVKYLKYGDDIIYK